MVHAILAAARARRMLSEDSSGSGEEGSGIAEGNVWTVALILFLIAVCLVMLFLVVICCVVCCFRPQGSEGPQWRDTSKGEPQIIKFEVGFPPRIFKKLDRRPDDGEDSRLRQRLRA